MIYFRCKCGHTDFHTFMRYKSKDMERFRCKKCNVSYERIGNEYKEINLQQILDERLGLTPIKPKTSDLRSIKDIIAGK